MAIFFLYIYFLFKCPLFQVDMYMRRLRERSRRKRVVRDFQVVPQFFKKEREKAQVPPKKKSKDDK